MPPPISLLMPPMVMANSKITDAAGQTVRRLVKHKHPRRYLAGLENADWLAEEGYDPTFGARPIKRAIQQRIQNPLAVEILKQQFGAGSRVTVDYAGDEFTFVRSDGE